MANERLGCFAMRCDHIDHTRWNVSFLGGLRNDERHPRCLWRGLDDERASRDESRRDLHGTDYGGSIPWNDGADDANRLVREQSHLRSGLRRMLFLKNEALREGSVVAIQPDGAGRPERGGRMQDSHLVGPDRGDVAD